MDAVLKGHGVKTMEAARQQLRDNGAVDSAVGGPGAGSGDYGLPRLD